MNKITISYYPRTPNREKHYGFFGYTGIQYISHRGMLENHCLNGWWGNDLFGLLRAIKENQPQLSIDFDNEFLENTKKVFG